MFVLAVGLSLAVIVGGLFSFLVDSTTSSKQAQEELQQLYGCDGALRLATDEVRRTGDADIAKIEENLRQLATALKTDINPRTGRPYADIEAIEVKPDAIEVGQVGSDPFFGMQFVREGSEFVVIANPEASRGRTCRAQSPNRLRTISYFEFARVSLDFLTPASTSQATADSSGDIYTLEHTSPFRRLLNGLGFGRRERSPNGPVVVNAIRIADNETFRPVPPSGQPWSFINKKKRTFGGTKRRTKHKKPIVEYFTKWPTNTPTIDPTLSRFAMQADLRIVDGVWYLNDRSFPGLCTWSDRPANSPVCAVHRGSNSGQRLQFSAYEAKGTVAGGGAAIIRYGIIAKNSALLRRPIVKSVCPGDEPGFVEDDDGVPFYRCADNSKITIADLTAADREILKDPYIAAAQTGFFDPYITGGDNTPILPIVLDVAALAAAMNTKVDGDLGEFRCLDDDDVLCPENRRFRGSLWVGSLPSSIFANGTPKRDAPRQPLPDGTLQTPCPLLTDDSTTCVRPNAVVIINAENLEAFVHTGLSIASNLPIYVVGGINNTTPVDVRTARVALMGPVITGLSTDFDFGDISYIKPRGSTAPSSSETLEWHASLFTSWAQKGNLASAQRDPTRDILRRLENGLRINVTGSMVAMFRRSDYDKIQTFNRSRGSFSSPTSDAMVAGIPTFEVNSDNLAEGTTRAASGTLRFPAEDQRDLRRAKFDRQPPASPRFSIDRAPIDRR